MPKAKSCCPATILAALMLCAAALSASAQSEPADTDAETSGRVKAALAADPHLLARHIDVTVKDGVVHLGGSLESGEDLKRALQDVHAVPGVTIVDNKIELKRGQSGGN